VLFSLYLSASLRKTPVLQLGEKFFTSSCFSIMLEQSEGVCLGIVYIVGRVRGPSGEEEVRFLVDSGATYTVLPEKVWKNIGLKPMREHEFTLADGTVIKREFQSATSPSLRVSAIALLF
jgi:hypothetical protein